MTQPQKTRQKPHHVLANLGFNIIIPTIILIKLSSEDYLGPFYSIIVALAFPVIYGLHDYWQAKKINLFSVLGIISVIVTGVMGLLQWDPQHIAIKEAAVPALLAVATLYSMRTRYPLVKTFLYNDQLLQIDKVKAALISYGNGAEFDRRLKHASYMVAGSFVLSSILNYLLAKAILVAEPGSVEFTAQLGKMNALSLPVIALPCTVVLMVALFYLLHHIKQLTHLDMEDIFNAM